MAQASLILELQALAQSGSTEITELLRRAKVVAVKLGLSDMNAWVQHELDGYRNGAKPPPYRRVGAQLGEKTTNRGILPILLSGDKDLCDHFAHVTIPNSVAQIASLLQGAETGHVHLALTPSESQLLHRTVDDIERKLILRSVGTSALVAILDAIRNRILNWSLELEQQGILGEGMTFTAHERQVAASSVTINNYGSVGAVVGHAADGAVQQPHGSSTVATATNSPGATVTAASGSASIQQRIRVSIEQAAKHDPDVATAIQRVADAIAGSAKLAQDQRQAEAQELILAIAEECSKPPTERQPAARSKGLAAGMREVLSLAADVLQVWTVCWPSIAPALGVIA